MTEYFFKVTIAEKINIPLSITEMRDNPTFEMYLAEYHEKLINVMVRPCNNFNEKKFLKLMSRKLKLKYLTDKVEYLEKIKLLQ